MTPDDSLVESGERIGTSLTAGNNNHFVCEIRALLDHPECNPETRFVLELVSVGVSPRITHSSRSVVGFVVR